jgi:hypothetical protein
MTAYIPQPLRFKAGIQRDGTRLDAPGNWVDGQWVRWVDGNARKIKGYRQITDQSDGIPRSFENHFKGGTHYLHIGSSSNLRQLTMNTIGDVSAPPASRTPGAYTMQGDELWQMDTSFDPITANSAAVVAHPGRNLNDISNSTKTSIYMGDATSTNALTALSGISQVSGGICVVHPYLTFFGSDGYFGWTAPNNFNDMTTLNGGGEAYPTSQKIVRGFPIRGGNGPAGLYFSLDSVIRTSYVGGKEVWAFDTVTDRTTIMSSRSIAMARNDTAYWMGTDGFYMYNGNVAELPNVANLDWVYNNINMSQRQKCFAFCNTRFGEVWFCFPFGDATECTHAAIYNYRTNNWYDTELPNGGRSGAISPSLYPYPIMGGIEAVSGSYRVWEHESGVDEVRGSSVIAVHSYVESADVTMLTGDQPSNATISCAAVEADIKQTGDMTLTITGNANARSPTVDSSPITFSPGPVSAPGDQILRSKVERRQMRFRWDSNVAGGYYELGLPIALLSAGSGRETG